MGFGQQKPTMAAQLEFPYKPSIAGLLVAIAFFGSIAFVFGGLGITHGNGMDLELHGIPLRGMFGDIVFWTIAAASGGMAFWGILGIMSALTADDDGMLRLSDAEIQIPYGIAVRRLRTIPFRDVTSVRLLTIQNQSFLEIKYAGGKIAINPKHLPSKTAFDDVCVFVAQRAKWR